MNNKGVSFATWILEDEQTRTMRNVDSNVSEFTAYSEGAASSSTAAAAGATAPPSSPHYSADSTWRWVLLGLCSGSVVCTGVSLAVLGAAGRKATFTNMLDINLTPRQSRMLFISNFLSVAFAGVTASAALSWFASRRSRHHHLGGSSGGGFVSDNSGSCSPVLLPQVPSNVSQFSNDDSMMGMRSPRSDDDAAGGGDDDDNNNNRQKSKATNRYGTTAVTKSALKQASSSSSAAAAATATVTDATPVSSSVTPRPVEMRDEETQTAGIPASPLSVDVLSANHSVNHSPLSPLNNNNNIREHSGLEDDDVGAEGEDSGNNNKSNRDGGRIMADDIYSSPMLSSDGDVDLAAFVPHALRTIDLPHRAAIDRPNVTLEFVSGSGGGGARRPSVGPPPPASESPSSPDLNQHHLHPSSALVTPQHGPSSATHHHHRGGANYHNNGNKPTTLGQAIVASRLASPNASSLPTSPNSSIAGSHHGARHSHHHLMHGQYKWWDNISSANACPGSILVLHIGLKDLHFTAPVMNEGAKHDVDAVARLVSLALEIGDAYGAVVDSFNLHWVVMSFNVLKPCLDYERAAAHCALAIRTRFIQVSASHLGFSPDASPASSPASTDGSPLTNPSVKPLVPFSIGLDRGLILSGHIGNGSVLRSFVLHGATVARARDLALLGTTCFTSMSPVLVTDSFNDVVSAHCSSLLVEFVEFATDACGRSTFGTRDASGDETSSVDSPYQYQNTNGSNNNNNNNNNTGDDISPQPHHSHHHNNNKRKTSQHIVNIFDLYEEFHESAFSPQCSPGAELNMMRSPQSTGTSTSSNFYKSGDSLAQQNQRSGDFEDLKHSIIADYTQAVTCLRSGALDRCLDMCAALEGRTMAAFTVVGGNPIVNNDSLGAESPPHPVPGEVISPQTGARMPVWLYQVKRHMSRLRRNAQSLLARGLDNIPFARHTQSRWSMLAGVDDQSPTATPLLVRHLDVGVFGSSGDGTSGSRETSLDMNATYLSRSVKLGETTRSVKKDKKRLEDSPSRMLAALQHRAAVSSSAQRLGSELRSPNNALIISSPVRSSTGDHPATGSGSGSGAGSGDSLNENAGEGGGGGAGGGGGLAMSASQLFVPREPSPVPELFQDLNGTWYRMSQKVLGTGAFGAVRLGIRPVDGVLVAMKILSLEEDEEPTDITSVRRRRQQQQQQRANSPDSDTPAPLSKLDRILAEVHLLTSLRHGNVVSLLNCAVVGTNCILLLEFVSGGSLESLMKNFASFDVTSTQRYLKDVLRGLRFLHEKGYIHRDIKPANILMHIDGSCKLADLGSGIAVREQVKKPRDAIQGTPYYMSPEACQGHVVFASDIWSVGIVACQLVSGRIPLRIANDRIAGEHGLHRLLYHLMNEEIEFEFPDAVLSDPNLLSFVQACLKPDPVSRPTAEELLMHPFLMHQMRNRDVVSTSPSASRRRGGSKRPPPSDTTPSSHIMSSGGGGSSSSGPAGSSGNRTPASPNTAAASSGPASGSDSFNGGGGPPSCNTTQ